MSNKHTPGPWEVYKFSAGHAPWVRATSGEHVTSLDSDNEEELEANAALIAAAPGLLDALRRVGCRASKVYLSGNVCADAPDREPCFVCAAIAKAEGKS